MKKTPARYNRKKDNPEGPIKGGSAPIEDKQLNLRNNNDGIIQYTTNEVNEQQPSKDGNVERRSIDGSRTSATYQHPQKGNQKSDIHENEIGESPSSFMEETSARRDNKDIDQNAVVAAADVNKKRQSRNKNVKRFDPDGKETSFIDLHSKKVNRKSGIRKIEINESSYIRDDLFFLSVNDESGQRAADDMKKNPSQLKNESVNKSDTDEKEAPSTALFFEKDDQKGENGELSSSSLSIRDESLICQENGKTNRCAAGEVRKKRPTKNENLKKCFNHEKETSSANDLSNENAQTSEIRENENHELSSSTREKEASTQNVLQHDADEVKEIGTAADEKSKAIFDDDVYISKIEPRLREAKTKKKDFNSNNRNTFKEIKMTFKQFLTKNTPFEWQCVSTGSNYDNTQVRQAVEFDVIMCISDRAIKPSYYPHTEAKNPSLCCLQKHVRNTDRRFDIFFGRRKTNTTIYLSPKKFYCYFENLVKEFLQTCDFKNVKILENKEGCPAVTLGITTNCGPISMDIVPAIRLHEWPPPARDWCCNWISKRDINTFKRQQDGPIERYNHCGDKYIYAVPKIHNIELLLLPEECIHFQLSFGEIEKTILRFTKCSDTCIKDVYKLLKQDIIEFYKLRNNFEKVIGSFHANHLLFLMRSESGDSEWESNSHLVIKNYKNSLLKFMESIETQALPFFFMPEVNLFEDKPLDGDYKKEILAFLKNKLSDVDDNCSRPCLKNHGNTTENINCPAEA